MFEDAFHGGDDLEALGGLSAAEAAADWLRDRAAGKPATTGEWLIPAHRGLGVYEKQPLERWQIDLA